MDYFLIVVLGIFVLVLWLSGRDATYELRRSIESLENEINRLREQLSAVLRAQKASQSTQVSHTESAPIAAPSVAKPPEPAPTQPAAQHTAPPAVAAYSAPPKPVVPVSTQAVQSAPPSTPAPKPSFEPVPRPHISISAQPATQATKPALAAEQPARDAKPFSLEETLGANWLNKLGIVILVIGLAFFLALKLQTWGPEGKVLCGYAISVLLLGGGVWLERKEQYRIFARGGIGGGWALAFFTTFAMHHLEAARILDSLATDLVLMLIVAAGMVAHSLFYRSQAVTGLAFLLGFATLLTSHVEAAENTVVFSLTASAVLALALVVVTTIRHWAVLELVGLLSVYLSHLVWLTRVLPQNHLAFAEFWPSTALILLYWLIFRLAYVLRTPLDKSEENISSISAIFNSGGVLGLLKFQSAHPEWAFWALMALGCAEMALAFWTRPRRRQAFVVLSTIATVLLVASVPFRFHGVSWPVLWLVQAQVLAICGLRLGEPVFRRLGLLAGLDCARLADLGPAARSHRRLEEGRAPGFAGRSAGLRRARRTLCLGPLDQRLVGSQSSADRRRPAALCRNAPQDRARRLAELCCPRLLLGRHAAARLCGGSYLFFRLADACLGRAGVSALRDRSAYAQGISSLAGILADRFGIRRVSRSRSLER